MTEDCVYDVSVLTPREVWSDHREIICQWSFGGVDNECYYCRAKFFWPLPLSALQSARAMFVLKQTTKEKDYS